MTETITVYFKPLGSFDGTTYYHETLVYTNSNNQSFYTQAFASDPTPAAVAGGPASAAAALADAMAAAAINGPSPFGTLQVQTNVAFNPSVVANSSLGITNDGFNIFPSQTVAEGSNLSSQWAEINAAFENIGNEDIPYSPLTQNSNSTANSALEDAGIALPSNISPGIVPPDGNDNKLWVPGGDNTLPINITLNTDESGNSVVTASDSSGSMTFVSSPSGNSVDATTTNANDNVTVTDNGTINPDGSQTEDVTGFNSNGSVLYTQNTTTSSNGQLTTISISGTGDSDFVSNAAIVFAPGTQATITDSNTDSSEFIIENTDGSGSFTDVFGDQFASYTAGQLTGSTTQVNGNAINTYNSLDQLLNSSQGISLGTNVSGILDQTYSAPGSYNFSQIVVPASLKQTNGLSMPWAVNDSGEVAGWFGAPVSGPSMTNGFTEQNGTYVALNPPQFNGQSPAAVFAYGINDSGTVVGTYANSTGQPIAGFVDTNGSFSFVAVPEPQGSNNPYYPTELTAISNNGIMVGHYNGGGGLIDNNGTITTVSTPWSGTGAYFSGVNNSGVMVGNGLPGSDLFETDSNTMTGDAFVDNNGVFTQIIDPNAYSVSGPNQPTPWNETRVSGINDNGVIVGSYTDSNQKNHGFIYYNGSYATVNYPSATETFLTGINDNGQVTGYYVVGGVETGFTATLNGSDTLLSTTLEVTNSGTVNLGSLAQMTSTATINLEVAGDTVTAAANVETINGSGNDTFNVGSNAAVGDVINDSVGNNTLTAGNVSGLTFNASGGNGNNSLTLGNGSNNWLDAEQTHGNNSLSAGSGTNNTLDVSFSSGTNTLTSLTGSSDYLNAQSTTGVNTLQVGDGNSNTLSVAFGTKNNSLTAGNGTGDYLNAESSQGANTLVAGGGANDTLDVSFSSGNNTVTAGNGNNDFLNAQNSSGNNALTAGSGSGDQFSAVNSTGRNTFNVGTGSNTVLLGGEGYTSYKFGSTFGQDRIYNAASPAGTGASATQGEVDFSSGVTSNNLWFAQSGNDLVVTLLGTADTITVKGWFSGTAGTQVQTFNAGGLSLANSAVASLVSAMATYQSNNPSFNPSTATSMPSNSALAAALAVAWPGSVNSSNVTVAYAEANQSALDAIGSYTVADSSANVVGGLTFLTSDASHIGSITLTDGSTPTLSLTASQYSSDTAALAKISSAYNLAISGVTAANASTTAAAAHVTSITVSDTGANVVANIAALETLATSGSELSSITLTDSSTPTLALTASQYAADTAALAKITSAYNLSISGVSAANASTIASAAHVTSISVSDTGANIVANIAALETLATSGSELSSITLTDSSTPTLSLTATQYSSDTAALAKIGNAYNLSISGVTAANASSTAAAAHVTSISVSDTGANVVANISALETLATSGSELSSITLTDGSTPTLSLTAAQYSADTAALAKITSAYNLAISGVTAANASTVAGAAHVTSITVSDTGANVVSNIASLETVATNGKLSSITLTDSSTPTLALTASQFTADGAVLVKIGSNYNLSLVENGVTFVFAKNALTAVSVNGSSVTFTVASAATGFTETITWTSGSRALLNLTNSSNQTFSSSLSSLSSGETVQVTSSMVTVYSSSGVAQNATRVNADGSQNDITYNTTGSGSWAQEIYTYNAAGTLISIGWLNNDTSTWTSYYDSNGTLQANVSVNANGSGYIATNNNQTLNFAAGDALSNISVTTSGTVNVTVTPSGGTAETLALTSSGITSTISGHTLADTLSGTNASIDGSGNITFTAPATGFGNDTLVANANGNDTFALGSDSLTFAGNALSGISFANGAFTYNIPSAASGYTETLTWNPSSGKAILNITNNSNNQSFATSLGYINPGYVLSVNNTGSSLTNSSTTQALYTTQVNADGSQNDISYDAPGGSEFDNIYTYSASGVLTEIQYNNNNGTFVHDFYNASGTLTGQTIYNGGTTLNSTNSNITAENTSSMTTLNVTGTTWLTAAQLAGFTTLTNSSGSTDTIEATTAGSYSIASKTVTGNFNLDASQTSASVSFTGNNQAGQTLTGGSGADTLTPGTGNDTLNGGTGYTTYDFGSSFGQDTINNAFGGNTTAKGEIDLTSSSVTDENLWFVHSGNNLVIDLLGTNSQITVSNWFGSNAGADVQEIKAGGLEVDSQLASLISAMATYQTNNPSFNPATASSMPSNTTLQNAIAASWHH